MEKQGVVQGEKALPSNETKQAADKRPCCGGTKCGEDAVSKMTEAMATPPKPAATK